VLTGCDSQESDRRRVLMDTARPPPWEQLSLSGHQGSGEQRAVMG